MSEFFVVLREDDLRLFRHVNRADAWEEAARLAVKHPGQQFFICRAGRRAFVDPRTIAPVEQKNRQPVIPHNVIVADVDETFPF